MSFTRLPYDTCSYVYDVDQSMKIGEYNLNTPINNDQTFYPNPSVPLNKYGGSVCENTIDVDSELMGLNVKHTKCPSKKYKPTTTPFCKLVHMKESDHISSEETRMSNPPCTLRGTGWNRWEWLCSNPQDTAITPFETNINNRIVVKDNHRPCIPNPMDQSLSLPDECNSGKYPLQDWNTYQSSSYPIVHWRCCGEIEKL
tara:strand:+ start:330 stop:929 length:600 start_codon:yes stop_codon:yes gene_type:complete